MKPVFNLKAYGGRSFVLASAVLWNDLPRSIKDSQSVETFKQKLTMDSDFYQDNITIVVFYFLL